MITAYPLCWPQGQPRTPPHKIRSAPFKMDDEKAKRELVREITLLGGRGIIISSNVPVRQDGMPYADAARRRMTDAGVAVYFDLKGEQKCFACDRWERVRENIRAIGMSISALRGMERWGSSDIMDRAFRGFTALPPPIVTPVKNWKEVLGFKYDSDPEWVDVKANYNTLAREHHPDYGGDSDRMADINAAMDKARREFGVA